MESSVNLYQGLIATCPECGDEKGVCEHRYGYQLDIWRESNRDDEPTCIHGLSEWLCMGPNHYPSREDEMEGRYF